MLSNLKRWALEQSRGLAAAGALAIALVAAQPAESLRAICLTDEAKCWIAYECHIFRDDGSYAGSIRGWSYHC